MTAGVAWGDGGPPPLLWGFDDIGVPGPHGHGRGGFADHPKAAQLIEEFGFNLWVTWYPDDASSRGLEANRAYVRHIDDFCASRGIRWLVNPLAPLWLNAPATSIDETGFDWFNRPDGRRFFRFPDALLAELGRCRALVGIVYDEAEHHQNNANAVAGVDRPSIYAPTGPLEDAAEGHTAAAAQLARDHARFGLRLYTEHVFPVMYHDFARAGFTPATKVLKEAWTPVYLACAAGAALEYGTPFWVSPDLWGVTGYPGHSPDEYRSALLLAYHMGADCVYTESLALEEGEVEGLARGRLDMLPMAARRRLGGGVHRPVGARP